MKASDEVKSAVKLVSVQLIPGAVVPGGAGVPAVSRLYAKGAIILDLEGNTIKFRAKQRTETITIPMSAVVYYVREDESR